MSSSCCTMARRAGARFCGVCGSDTATGARPRLRGYGRSIVQLAMLVAGLGGIPLATWFGAEARGAAKAGLTGAWSPAAAPESTEAPAERDGGPVEREGDTNERVGELLAAWRAPAKAASPAAREGETPAATPAPPTAVTPTAPPPSGPTSPAPVRLSPSNVTASSESVSRSVSYGPWNVVDGDPGTGWQVSDSGPGEWIELQFGHAVTLSRIGVVPGYDKILPDRVGDRWPLNNRVSDVQIVTESGTVTHHFSDSRPMQWVDLGGVATSWVTILVVSVYPGLRWNDTVVAEVQAEGTP
jgi:hypothetical protein